MELKGLEQRDSRGKDDNVCGRKKGRKKMRFLISRVMLHGNI